MWNAVIAALIAVVLVVVLAVTIVFPVPVALAGVVYYVYQNYLKESV